MESSGRKDESREESDNINRMAPSERLSYIYSLAKFYKQIGEYSKEAMDSLIDKLLCVTDKYKR